MANRETRLPRTPSILDNDYVRIVQQDSSRNITFADFASEVNGKTGPGSFTSVTSNLKLTASAPNYILCDTTDSPIAVTLPSASEALTEGSASKIFNIKKTTTDTNDVTITSALGEKIDGQSSVVLTGTSYPYVEVISDGTNWYVTGA